MPAPLAYFAPSVFIGTLNEVRRGASILLYKADGVTLATHYTDAAGSNPSTSAFTADSSSGNWWRWVPGNTDYTIKVDGLFITDAGTNAKTLFRPTLVGRALLDVTNFGAISNAGSAVNKPAFERAEAALHATPNGGDMFVPAGDYDVGDWVGIRLPYAGERVHNWFGEGFGSVIRRSVDGVAATEFVDAMPGYDQGDRIESSIRHLRIQGPASGILANGTSPATMNGIGCFSRMQLENVRVDGWHSGLVIRGDHISFIRVSTGGNGNGAEYTRGVSTSDRMWDECIMNRNTLACFSVAPGSQNYMGGEEIRKGHYGNGPYVIFCQTGSGTSANGGTSVANVKFHMTSFEGIGNGWLHSEGQTAIVTNLVIDQCRPFSINNAIYGLPSSTKQYMIHADLVANLTIRDTIMSGYGESPTVAYINALRITGPLRWEGWLGTFIDASQDASQPALICCPSINGGVYLTDGGYNSSTFTGIKHARAYGPTGTVAAGDVVTFGPNQSVTRPTAYGMIAGVVLKAPTKTNELVIVAREADAIPVNTDSTAFNINHRLEQSGTNFHRVVAVNQNAVSALRPLVGKATVAVNPVVNGVITGRVEV